MAHLTRASLMRATGRTRREIDELLALGLPHVVAGVGRGSEIQIDVDAALAWLAARVLDGADASPVKERIDELKAQKLELELDEKRGTLVERQEVNLLFFDLAKLSREHWETWPARVASELAGKLKVTPHLLQNVLSEAVKANLASLKAAATLQLRGDKRDASRA